MWACTSPELYDLLVLRPGWKAEQFGEFVGHTLEVLVVSEQVLGQFV
jgi:hypothetical protein